MATTYRTRGSNRSKSTDGGYSGYFFGSGPNSTWGRTSTGSKNTGPRKNNKRNSGPTANPTAYRTCCTNFEKKIDSFKALCAQAQGSGTWSKPTPTTLNAFANWVNKGAIVQTCTPSQVSRWARNTNKNFNPRNPSPTSCKTVLTAKFGRSAIKCVARTKSGHFIVATTPTINGRSFCFPQ